MSDDEYNICPHGEKVLRDACPRCVADFEALPAVSTLTADQRADEVIHLLTDATWAGFDRIFRRITELVGRDVYTHEMAVPEMLAREARTREHPVDLKAHVIGLADQLMGTKPVVVIDVDKLDADNDDAPAP